MKQNSLDRDACSTNTTQRVADAPSGQKPIVILMLIHTVNDVLKHLGGFFFEHACTTSLPSVEGGTIETICTNKHFRKDN